MATNRSNDINPETPLALSEPSRHAQRFERIRSAHQMETAEDYVELIADLIAVNGEARVSDLSARFGVSHATVNKVVARLNREGFVANRPYRSLFLTAEGEKLAAESRRRHHIVRDFLIALGLPADIAEGDAEGVEHHVSQETLAAFEAFLANRK